MSFEKVLTPEEILRNGGIDPSLLGTSKPVIHPEAPSLSPSSVQNVIRLPNVASSTQTHISASNLDVNTLSEK